MTAWLVDTLISLTILLALVLAAREPVARLFGAGWAYALWLLPLARLVMPPVDFGLIDLFPSAPAVMILVPEATQGFVPQAAAEPSGAGIGAMLLAIWFGGAVMFALWQQSAYGAFTLSIGDAPRAADPPSHGGLPVVESGAVDGPIAVGFVKRRIVVPTDFATRYSADERALALEHELIHHRRGDIWWNLAALAMLGLLWFHPLAWLAYRAFRSDQELACDSAVAARIAQGGRHTYARALVKSATRPGQIVACPLNRADQLKRRLKMMKQHRSSRARTLGGGAALAALAGGGLLVASPGIAQREPDAEVIVAPPAQPIISKADMAVLAERCTGLPRGSFNGSGVQCSEEDAKDPQVRRILDTTRDRADAYARRAVAQAERAVQAAVHAETQATAAIAAADAAAPTEAIAEIVEARAEAARERAEAIAEARQDRIEAVADARAAIAEARAEAAAAREEARAEAREAQAEARASIREAQLATRQVHAVRIRVHAPLAPPAPPAPPARDAPDAPRAPAAPAKIYGLSHTEIARIHAAAIAAAEANARSQEAVMRVRLARLDRELEAKLANLRPRIERDVQDALRAAGIED